MAEEYVDAGRWKPGGVPFRLTKAVERAAIRRARGIVVLTERVRRQLFGSGPTPSVWVIPCCADLRRIEASSARRAELRTRLGIGDGPVLVYVGKFTGWYMAREMAEFFTRARSEIDDLQLLVLTQGDHEDIQRELLSVGAPTGTWRVTSSAHDEVGAHLAAADAAISFIQPSPSKASSSPTKIGEYLAAGLPVVATSGVGDLDAQLGPDVAVLVATHDERAHHEAAVALRALIDDPATAERCHVLAHTLFSLDEVGVPRYLALYRAVSSSWRSAATGLTRSRGHE
jgi:glycosyltransferase involved in cell wall biosynthesis